MSYPDYIDGEPPVVGMIQYDQAAWAGTTSIDRQDGVYVIVETAEPTKIVAKVDPKDTLMLDMIFQDAHKEYAKQINDKNVQTK
ncbi:hypothetical protein PSN45_004696 [Yamadazyma tenuis]|uniref:Uncharacterized protein n=1 Tax=Candida tenuis (strain ATCC 10573 / BCRC 21748 / CBS 615 / JCM 9827 / NBRC 10315 / NRRL Y-1498 / VKM Y-70) TaxID=590646 RepID=G3B6W1_CANTC|nr:uncharacterized protein CANTEDRAFT_106351 [Yamadazyma tenuis ATCC 10573]EGV63036.1 hypothetical protein CANTEDRAFT_106351 [Yamadazyma tenuis ATCC 10573]WEJ97148.1 hypothetical protein PSN45_004696 [Yamadazyma tenuis]